MSLQNVEAFYQRLARDEDFRNRLKTVKNKEQCKQIVQSAGYDFTQEELETYIAQQLTENHPKDELKDLDKQELEMVVGGLTPLLRYTDFQPPYGVVTRGQIPD